MELELESESESESEVVVLELSGSKSGKEEGVVKEAMEDVVCAGSAHEPPWLQTPLPPPKCDGIVREKGGTPWCTPADSKAEKVERRWRTSGRDDKGIPLVIVWGHPAPCAHSTTATA